MKLINKLVIDMDRNGKVGWNEEGFEKLSYVEKVLISTYNLLAQVYNGGFEQYYYNGYGFADEFLKEEVAEVLDIPELKAILKDANTTYKELKNLDLDKSRCELEDRLDFLDEEFYENIAEELEGELEKYLKN